MQNNVWTEISNEQKIYPGDFSEPVGHKEIEEAEQLLNLLYRSHLKSCDLSS